MKKDYYKTFVLFLPVIISCAHVDHGKYDPFQKVSDPFTASGKCIRHGVLLKLDLGTLSS